MSDVPHTTPGPEAVGPGYRPRFVAPDGVGWLLWAVFAVVVATSQLWVEPFQGNVFKVYRDAGCHWWAGQPLYNNEGTDFIYLPQCAVLCIPLRFMSFYCGGVVWRILNIGVFAFGVWRFVGMAARNGSPAMFSLVSLIVASLSWSAARHGQMTMMMGAMMLLAVVDLVDRRWWRAVLLMALGFAFKPLIVVLMLLAAMLYPHTSWRLLLAMIALALLPLVAQRPEYAIEQYCDLPRMFHLANQWGATHGFPNAFWVLKSVGIDLPETFQTVMQLLAAALTLGICWLAQRRCNAVQAGVLLYTLAVGYLMLFNPRTEHNSYCLLAVALAVFTTQAIAARHWLTAATLIGIAVAMLVSYQLGKLLPTVWLKPLVCIVFLAIVLYQFYCALPIVCTRTTTK
jgi:hypothetical protein